MQVFTDETANGDSEIASHGGGSVQITVGDTESVFGGATVTAYAKFADMTNFSPLDGGVWTEASSRVMDIPGNAACDIKLVISDASGTTSISAWI